MENETVKIDRSLKIIMLQGMQRGYFTKEEIQEIKDRLNIKCITVEIVDKREQVDES